MTQEQFEAIGIEKSLAKKAAEASKKELEGYVSKDTYDQTEQQRKQLEDVYKRQVKGRTGAYRTGGTSGKPRYKSITKGKQGCR